jgi:branched-chain amino acid transport system substrate-binding protein
MRPHSPWLTIVALVAVLLALAPPAQAQKTLNVATLADFTGPYADVMKPLIAGRIAALDWWNGEVGAKLGVKLNHKTYDVRYDTAQTASLWPGIKSELNPIAVLGLGGPDVAALQQRLPDDKIPLLMSTAGYAFAWKPGSWVFNPRPTYAHEMAGFLEWYHGKLGKKGRLKVAVVSSEASPAYVDIHKGLQAYAAQHDTIEVVEVIVAEVQPTDLSAQVRRVVNAGAEAITISTNTAAVVATKRALQAHGKKVPIVTSSHNALQASGKAAGGLAQMEGDYEVYAMALAVESGPSYDFYKTLRDKYGLKSDWTVLTVQGVEQGLFAARAIENAVRKVGADKVTGAAVREALATQPISSQSTFGFTTDLRFSDESNLPTAGTVNIATVEGGKYKVAATNVKFPALKKW